MPSGSRKARFFLFAGDILAFTLSLWVTLFVRTGSIPTEKAVLDHAAPFAILFLVWALVFYMAGLYEKRAFLFKRALPNALLVTQTINIVIAALFFFLIPFFGITPKTTLAIYLVVSLAAISLWRLVIFARLARPKARVKAALIGEGSEVDELVREVNGNPRYGIEFCLVRPPSSIKAGANPSVWDECASQNTSLLVVTADADPVRAALPLVYELVFVEKKYQYVDFNTLYEEVFDRVPVSLLQYDWFLRNVSHPTFGAYAFFKRIIDIVGGTLMGVITLAVTPLVWALTQLESPGSLFIVQERIGRYGSRVKAYKFRSMTKNKASSRDWTVEEENENKVTRVGSFLRLTSLDEFPQFINILRGELSLIGPRNDIEGLGKRLAEAIPYYNMRYIVTPGITGWAQINQQYEQGHISPQSIEETKTRLAYDFYYIKHRSLILDFVIALKTVKRMFFRVSNW